MWFSGRVALVGMALGCRAFGQTAASRDVDAGLAAQIAAIRAFDDHAHPVLPPPADKADREFDALPVDNMEAETDTVAWRADDPQLVGAWKALWGFDGVAPLDGVGVGKLAAAKAAVKAREGAGFDAWVLDQAGIGVMVANRVAMSGAEGAALDKARFRWVPYADALLFPLDNAELAAESPDKKLFFPMEDRVRERYLKAVGMGGVPATLEEYLSQVVTPTLKAQKAGGAVAEKFEVAYLRGFDFSDPTQMEAEKIYAKWRGQSYPNEADYKVLQDFLFRYIARECGRLGMAVHLHAMAGGGGYFGVAGANPLLLEPLFDDARLRKTKFVLLHGGWPFVREAGALLQKPNVYLDLSQETLTFSPRTLSGWLREWLETYPEKVLFGTDGYPYSDGMGWEESTWIASKNGREALGLALTGMMRDGEVTRARAEAIAAMVMRGSAEGLYGK
ncbi:amidohydrolase 2 [Granulicella sibirica]|uniref:Amidohydrolase 2 n=1 Tax=Granulicella sibirica TaxID=2479048 RepID=A0A4Q0T9A8_9BACT|nr:amidohydrolase 2 [Granulicella sibirica]